MKIGDVKKINGIICQIDEFFLLSTIMVHDKNLESFTFNFQEITTISDLTIQEISDWTSRPEFKRGDVVLQGAIYRIGFSWISEVGDFEFCNNSGTIILDNDSIEQIFAIKANSDQIKQLELEEMKNGKKWNGDGYDDWLTSDGLTLNELLEHSVFEIECENPRGNKGWHLTNIPDVPALKGSLLSGVNNIKRYRIKPKDTFVDVEIEWSYAQGSILAPNGMRIIINAHSIGQSFSDWFLSGYILKPISNNEMFVGYPIKFSYDGENIIEKATHARFIKVGE